MVGRLSTNYQTVLVHKVPTCDALAGCACEHLHRETPWREAHRWGEAQQIYNGCSESAHEYALLWWLIALMHTHEVHAVMMLSLEQLNSWQHHRDWPDISRQWHLKTTANHEQSRKPTDSHTKWFYCIWSRSCVYIYRYVQDMLVDSEEHMWTDMIWHANIPKQDKKDILYMSQAAPSANSWTHAAGSCRIRSRTQGIALSLGDRITIVQRGIQVGGTLLSPWRQNVAG